MKTASGYARDPEGLGKYCLTETQGIAIKAAITSVNMLSWAGRTPVPVPSYPVMLGQYIAYMYILAMILHFVAINDALEDCRV